MANLKAPAGAVLLIAAGLVLSACGPATVAGGPDSMAEGRALSAISNDNEISIAINTRFLSEKYRYSYLDVGANVYNGRVMLTGTVENRGDKSTATKLVGTINGVREVINELRIGEPGRMDLAGHDVSIETMLRSQVVSATGAQSKNYRWRCVNGIVYFIGVARSRAELDRVVTAARSMKQVRGVVNHVEVR